MRVSLKLIIVSWAITMASKRKKRHSLEHIVRKIREADQILAEGGDVAAVLWQQHHRGDPLSVAQTVRRPES